YANYVAPDPTRRPATCTQNHSNWYVGGHPIWAGAVNNAPPPEGYWQVQNGWRQTAFDAVCPGASGYSTWAGLGGYYGGSLAQTGTDVVRGGNLNDVRGFWEVISRVTGYDTYEASLLYGYRPSAGDDLYASVNWHGDTQSLEFHLIDATQGWDDPA